MAAFTSVLKTMLEAMLEAVRAVEAEDFTRSFTLNGDSGEGGVGLDIADGEVRLSVSLGGECSLLGLDGHSIVVQRAFHSVHHFFLQVLEKEVGMTGMVNGTFFKERTDGGRVVRTHDGAGSGGVDMNSSDDVMRVNRNHIHSRLYTMKENKDNLLARE